MKIDLVGPKRRGLALGLTEAAVYGGVALAAAASGWLAAEYAARDVLVAAGAATALLAFAISLAFVRDTTGHVTLEQAEHEPAARAIAIPAEFGGGSVVGRPSVLAPHDARSARSASCRWTLPLLEGNLGFRCMQAVYDVRCRDRQTATPALSLLGSLLTYHATASLCLHRATHLAIAGADLDAHRAAHLTSALVLLVLMVRLPTIIGPS